MAGTHIRFDWAIKKLLRDKANYVVLEAFISELLKEDIKKEGREEGEKQAKIEIAKSLKARGIDINLIVKVTGLSKAEIEKL